MSDKLLQKLAEVLRENFTDRELDQLFEIAEGTLLEVLEGIPPQERDEQLSQDNEQAG